MFEALIGAIFIDSGYSLQTVWEVIEPLLRPYIGNYIHFKSQLLLVSTILIERTVQHRNLNPIRAFHENNGKVYFGLLNSFIFEFSLI